MTMPNMMTTAEFDAYLKEYVALYHSLDTAKTVYQLRNIHKQMDDILEEVQLHAIREFAKQFRDVLDSERI